ncbi:unnamed protein product [Camellia sinensis]
MGEVRSLSERETEKALQRGKFIVVYCWMHRSKRRKDYTKKFRSLIEEKSGIWTMVEPMLHDILVHFNGSISMSLLKEELVLWLKGALLKGSQLLRGALLDQGQDGGASNSVEHDLNHR